MHDRRRDRALDVPFVKNIGVPVELAGRGIEACDAVLIADGDQLRGHSRCLENDWRRIGIATLARDTPAVLARVGIDGEETVLRILLAWQDHHAVVQDWRGTEAMPTAEGAEFATPGVL